MKVKDLIAKLEALAAPNADVYFLSEWDAADPYGASSHIDGGWAITPDGSDRQGVFLTDVNCSTWAGGF